MSGKKQHVQMFRKIALRRKIMELSEITSGNIFVPFIGDGDIASQMYPGFRVYGADLDPARVRMAEGRINGQAIVADCNYFPESFTNKGKYAAADFDAYSDPYKSFVSFWSKAEKEDKMFLFFTDGHRMGTIRTGWFHKPDGSKEKLETLKERRQVFNFYLPRYVMPWFEEFIKPYKIIHTKKYLRGMMIYWGAVIEK